MNGYGKKNQNSLIMGDWNAICPVCKFKYKASDMVRRWDGEMVCKKDVDPYHPQDLVRGMPDYQNVPWTRPEQEDVFMSTSGWMDDADIYNPVPEPEPEPPVIAFHPKTFFSSGEHGFIADIQDGSSLYTDVGKTTLASNSDTVAVVANSVNSYDMEQSGSTRRAKLNSLGSYNFLYGDGVDDYYQVNFGTTLTQPMTYVGVWLSVSGGASSAYYYDGMDASHRNALILQTGDELQQWAGTSSLLSTGNVPGTKEIVYNEFNGGYSHVRINNSYVCGPGNSGDDGPGSKMYILTSFSITTMAQHRLYWLMAINRVLTAEEQDDLHEYLKVYCGVTY